MTLKIVNFENILDFNLKNPFLKDFSFRKPLFFMILNDYNILNKGQWSIR